MRQCYGCFKEYEGSICPHCGYDETKQREKYPLALRPGSILNGRYIVGRVLGQGGFGITYVSWDDRKKERIAIKEYLPTEQAGRSYGSVSVQVYSGELRELFAHGKEQFLAEAKTLAEFSGNEHIVQVYSYFEENNTAYFTMEYVDGESLDKYMKNYGGRLSLDTANQLLLPVMDALDMVHSKGIIHRDIAPDNILVKADRTAKLIDFGAARYSTGEKSKSLDVILKHGFAPKEQYMRRGRQGAFTDVYAMAATYYYALTGKIPPEALQRLEEDEIIDPSLLGVKMPGKSEEVLMKALEVSSQDRYQTMGQFRNALTAELPKTLHKSIGKCVNGHIYNRDIYGDVCPYCQHSEAKPNLQPPRTPELISEEHTYPASKIEMIERVYDDGSRIVIIEDYNTCRSEISEFDGTGKCVHRVYGILNPKSEQNKDKDAQLEELRLQEEARRKAEEQKRLEEARRKEEAQRQKIAEEEKRRRIQEEARIAEEKRRAELAEAKRKEEERRRQSGSLFHKINKKHIQLLAAVAALLALLVCGFSIDESRSSKGSTATQNNWTFEDGTLFIYKDSDSSTGTLANFDNVALVERVVVSDGIEHVSEDAFLGFENLKFVYLPDSVKTIGDSAFWRCSSLSTVYFAGDENDWEKVEIETFNNALKIAEIAFNRSYSTGGISPTNSEKKPVSSTPKPNTVKTDYAAKVREEIKAGDYRGAYDALLTWKKKESNAASSSEYKSLLSDIEKKLGASAPENGETLERTIYVQGGGQLQVAAQNGDAEVLVTDVGESDKYVRFFVQQDHSALIYLPPAEYKVTYKIGDIWLGDDIGFGDYVTEKSYRQNLLFEIKQDNAWITNTIWRITVS